MDPLDHSLTADGPIQRLSGDAPHQGIRHLQGPSYDDADEAAKLTRDRLVVNHGPISRSLEPGAAHDVAQVDASGEHGQRGRFEALRVPPTNPFHPGGGA